MVTQGPHSENYDLDMRDNMETLEGGTWFSSVVAPTSSG